MEMHVNFQYSPSGHPSYLLLLTDLSAGRYCGEDLIETMHLLTQTHLLYQIHSFIYNEMEARIYAIERAPVQGQRCKASIHSPCQHTSSTLKMSHSSETLELWFSHFPVSHTKSRTLMKKWSCVWVIRMTQSWWVPSGVQQMKSH